MTEITFITGVEGSGKTSVALALRKLWIPHRDVIWFDEFGEAAKDLGARSLEMIPTMLRRNMYDYIIVSSRDSAALALVLSELPGITPTVRTILCQEPHRG